MKNPAAARRPLAERPHVVSDEAASVTGRQILSFQARAVRVFVRYTMVKRTSRHLSLLSDAEIQEVEDWVNQRPLKVLHFKTPHEVFTQMVKELQEAA